jgi:hypothetical protein
MALEEERNMGIVYVGRCRLGSPSDLQASRHVIEFYRLLRMRAYRR